MNNQGETNNNNNNIMGYDPQTGQPIYNQPPMNNQQPNPATQGFQQPVQQQPKKKNIALIVGLSIVGLFVGFLITHFILFTISSNKETVWQSGQIKIMDKVIQLPCDVDEFEDTLNTIIYDDEIYDGIVRLNYGYRDELVFDVDIENDKVTGINLNIYPSDADEYDRIMEENERHVASSVVFPGGITSDSQIEKVRELYDTKPINVWYNEYSETIEEMTETNDGWLSSSYRYHDDEWQINVHTKTNIRTGKEEITSIDYWYIKD